MSTSATASKRASKQRLLLIDLFAALFCAAFGAVYEAFGHGVWSYPMVYAFAFPLVLGVLPLLLLAVRRAPYPRPAARSLYHAGIAALTVGSLISGVLEIYGTTNPLTLVYWLLGGALTLLGAGLYLRQRCAARQACPPYEKTVY